MVSNLRGKATNIASRGTRAQSIPGFRWIREQVYRHEKCLFRTASGKLYFEFFSVLGIII
jgi:hypothetical protein